MAVIICQASLGSNGKISGDVAGNQNGRELNSSGYYADNTNKWHIMRSSDPVIAERVADEAEDGVKNRHVGYDQLQRNTLLPASERVGWRLSKVSEDVETDCVAFAAVRAAATGKMCFKEIKETSTLKKSTSSGTCSRVR